MHCCRDDLDALGSAVQSSFHCEERRGPGYTAAMFTLQSESPCNRKHAQHTS